MKTDQPYLKHINTKHLNPYEEAAKLIYNRVKYDIFTMSMFNNYWKIKKLKNTQRGKKCVIMCNGPSLNNVDFEKLEYNNVYTIGLNKINLLFNRTKLRPKLIASVNPYVIKQNEDFFEETEIPLFLDYNALRASNINTKKLNKYNQLHLLHSTQMLGTFACDISLSICQGSTVTYVALQIAYHLGFEHVTLVGCDHNFTSKGTPNQTIKLDTVDNNHFDPNYFSTADKWQLPDLVSSEYHYQIARETYFHTGRKVYNSTDGGNLDMFERLSIDEFLKL